MKTRIRGFWLRPLFAALVLSACAQGNKPGVARGNAAAPSPFAASPGAAKSVQVIEASPLSILDSDPATFKNGSYELFSWKALPGILIIRFRDYRAQDLWLKRLAFFVEKAGFRGRLAPDREIAGLHGWNAHDYRAADLARFFARAAAEAFPLGREELSFRSILLELGIIQAQGAGFSGNPGRAVISTSVESGRVMEKRFMAHELYHGIYFTDPAFAARSESLYAALDPGLKAYVEEFFDYKVLDVLDHDLMVNEFAAYFLQQPVTEASAYFGKTVADFLEADRGGKGAYLKRGKELWASFETTARLYDAMASELYGFAAGRAWR
jgi:hypothetical protein